ncbi:MAG: cupin-like domain-containing protein [bacterium]
MPNLLINNSTPIKEWHHVTKEIFYEKIAPLHQPAVLRRIVEDWPIVQMGRRSQQAISEYLIELSTNIPVQTFHGDAKMRGRFFYDDTLTRFNFTKSAMSLKKLLSILIEGSNDLDKSYIYAGAININTHIPDFLSAHSPPLLNDTTTTLSSIWLGNKTRIPLHWDLPRNIACVIAGRRQFTLMPPSQIPNLYIGPLDHTLAGQPCSLVDFHNPDYVVFPKFEQAIPYALFAELNPGDAIYIPSMWLHHVESMDEFGMLANYWWREGAPYLFTPLLTLFHSLLTLKGMPQTEKEAWQTIFDHYIFSETDPMEHIPNEAKGVFGDMNNQIDDKLRTLLIKSLMP